MNVKGGWLGEQQKGRIKERILRGDKMKVCSLSLSLSLSLSEKGGMGI
jgi:hypothetical protein